MPEQHDRPFDLNLQIDPKNPNLLAGLDRWLELGLIEDGQVRRLCQMHLACRVPVTITTVTRSPVIQPLPVASPIVQPEPRPLSQPSVLGNMWAAFKDELSVRWLLFLGVFLVVMSSGVLAATQWQSFPAWGQYGVLWAYTVAFWGVGFWASGQAGLKLTAGTLQTVALLLIPVNFWAIDSFQLWHNSWELLTTGLALASLSALTYLDFRQRQQQQGISPIAIAYLGASYLQLGWQWPGWATVAVYLGAIGGVGLWQRRRQIFRARAWQWASLAIYSLTILLLRALFIEHLPVRNFGLAIGIGGWLVAQWGLQEWTKIDRIQDIRTRSGQTTTRLRDLSPQMMTAQDLAGRYQIVAAFLLISGWLLAMLQWSTIPQASSWQPLSVSMLGLIWLGQKLQKRQQPQDLTWMFFVGLQTYGISFALAPNLIPWAKWDIWTRLFNLFGENAIWAGTLAVMPYLFLWIGITGWFQQRNQQPLARRGEALIFACGLLLNIISTPNHLGLLLNLLVSTLALCYITQRSVSVQTPLIYVTHLYGLITMAVGLDYAFPQWRSSNSIGVMWAVVATCLAIGEWLISTLPTVPGSAGARWCQSAWNYGLGLAAIGYGVYLSHENISSPLVWLWFLVPLALTGLGYQQRLPRFAIPQTFPWQLNRRIDSAKWSVGGLILAQGLVLEHYNWRLWGLGLAVGLMFFNVRRLRNPLVAAIHIGFGLGLLASFLERRVVGSAWLVVGTIVCLGLWLGASQLRRRENELAQLYAKTSDKWAMGLSLVGGSIGTVNYFTNYLPWLGIETPWMQWHHLNTTIAAAILAIGIWGRQAEAAVEVPPQLGKRQRPQVKSFPWKLWFINWTLQLGVAELIHSLGGNTLALAIFDIAIAFPLFLLTQRDRDRMTLLLPWIYGIWGLVLRLAFFNSYTGALTIAVGVIGLLVGRRLAELILSYFGLLAITLGCYEVVAYQLLHRPSAGGNIADAFTVYGLVTAILALGYRLWIWWWERRGNDQWLNLPLSQGKTIAHLHWVGASAWKVSAALVPQLPVPHLTPIHLGISVLLGLYAIIQGREQEKGDWWVYVGMVEIVGTGMYARSILPSLGIFDESLILITCILGIAILLSPWSNWGWQTRPWRRIAVVLPLLRVAFAADRISLLNLLVIAGFYAGVAKRQKLFAWVYVSLLFVDWAAFRVLDLYQLRDPLWFVTVFGISLLACVQFDPYFQSTNQRQRRHWMRLLGCGSIAIVAMIFHQDIPLVPAGISLLLTLAGMALCIRAFLYMGTITLMLTVSYQLIILITEYSFTKWIVGLVAGVLIIAIAGNFERRREQIYNAVQNWLNRLQDWQ
jgi:hypothetical protein